MPDSILIKALQSRIEEMSTDLNTVREELKERQLREQSLARSLEAYRIALKTESDRNGAPKPDATTIEAQMPLVSESTIPAASSTTTPQDEAIDKTQFIHKLIQSSASGITALELWEKIGEARIRMNRSYIYAVLGRLLKSEKIQEKDGRYYPKHFPR